MRRWLADALLCLPVLGFGLFATPLAAANQPDSPRAPDAYAYGLVVVAALALAAHRRPWLAFALNGTAIATYLTAGYPYGPILLTVPLMIFLVAARWPVWRAVPVAGGYLVAFVAAATVKEFRETTGPDVVEPVWFALAWTAIAAAAFAVGTAVRIRREAAARVRAEQVQRAASDERLRMAQELHDTIGHGLAAIAMQAGVALYILDRDPGSARRAMEAVRATSRESLDNLRAELDMLRGAGGQAARRPAPGLADLEQLADRVRAGGVTVTMEIAPDLADLPSTVDAAAYRIVQEALTNVLRHVGESTARIRVALDAGVLLVDVCDSGAVRAGGAAGTAGGGWWPAGASGAAGAAGGGPAGAGGAVAAGGGRRPAGARGTGGTADAGGGGRAAGAGGGGSGIRGMRAQAEALGGSLQAGPRPAGGFAVTARLPLDGP